MNKKAGPVHGKYRTGIFAGNTAVSLYRLAAGVFPLQFDVGEQRTETGGGLLSFGKLVNLLFDLLD